MKLPKWIKYSAAQKKYIILKKYWDKIYHLTFKGVKIPYQITKGKKEAVLNFNKKDYPDQVNKILKRKYPTLKTIQHNTHYTEFKR